MTTVPPNRSTTVGRVSGSVRTNAIADARHSSADSVGAPPDVLSDAPTVFLSDAPTVFLSDELTVFLSDELRVLALFTQGIAGRYVHLKASESLTGQFRPIGASTDGKAVFVPEQVSTFADARHNVGVYRVAILHQLGYFHCGTFDFSLPVARTRLGKLPPDVTFLSERALDLERFFALWEAPALMRRLFMTLEDLRIDSDLQVRFPGARNDLQRVMAHALSTRPDMFALGAFAGLLEGLVQFTLGQPRAVLAASDGTGMLDMMLEAAEALRNPGADVYTSAQVAVVCFEALSYVGLPRKGQVGTNIAGQTGDARGSDAWTDQQGGSAPLDEDAMGAAPVDFRGEVQPELIQRQMRLDTLIMAIDGLAGVMDDDLPPEALDRLIRDHGLKDPGAVDPLRTSRGLGADDAAAYVGADEAPELPDLSELKKQAQSQRDEIRRHAELDRAALRRAFGDVDSGARSFLYDEWDYHAQIYLKGYCRLFEHRLSGEDFDFIHGVRERHAELRHKIKRQFKFIRPESFARVRRLRDGDELDLDSLIEARVDQHVGITPDDRLYMRRDKAKREVAAAFLLDMSASTDDAIVDPDAPPPEPVKETEDDPFLYGFFNGAKREPEPPRRRVIDVAKESLALMSEALETLGDGFAVYGFSGYGREEVEFYVAKEFEESLSSRTWASIAAMKPRRSTRMGPAIRHAVKKLTRQDVRMKVLIMVSDGFPQDCDYGPDRTDHEYGIQDTAKALKEAEHAGVQTFCVTIDQSGHDYLRRMCPDARYLVIDEVPALPTELSKVYRALTL